MEIDLKGINKAEVLAKLYNASQVQGLGFLQARVGDMTIKQAEELLEKTTYFDYLHGRVMKINLSGDSFDPWLYDRDNGQGRALSVLKDYLEECFEPVRLSWLIACQEILIKDYGMTNDEAVAFSENFNDEQIKSNTPLEMIKEEYSNYDV